MYRQIRGYWKWKADKVIHPKRYYLLDHTNLFKLHLLPIHCKGFSEARHLIRINKLSNCKPIKGEEALANDIKVKGKTFKYSVYVNMGTDEVWMSKKIRIFSLNKYHVQLRRAKRIIKDFDQYTMTWEGKTYYMYLKSQWEGVYNRFQRIHKKSAENGMPLLPKKILKQGIKKGFKRPQKKWFLVGKYSRPFLTLIQQKHYGRRLQTRNIHGVNL